MYIISGLFNIIYAQYQELDIELNTIFKESGVDIDKLNNPISKLDIGIFGRYIEQVVKQTKNNRVGLETGFRIPFTLTATFFNLYRKSNHVRDLFAELGKYDSTTNNLTRYRTKEIDGLFYYEISVCQLPFFVSFPFLGRYLIRLLN